MPTFAELLSYFSFLASTPAAWGALLTAGLIVIFFDWRILVLAFACQAVFIGLLFSQNLPPQVAGIKMMVGLLIAVQMFITGRQIASRRGGAPSAEPPLRPRLRRVTTGFPFRVVVAVMVILISWQVSLSGLIALPNVSPAVSLAVIGLVAMGLLGLGLTEEPLKAGLLLLTVLGGFELYYSAVEPALAVIALLAAMNFAVALGVCYLAAIKGLPEPGETP